LAPIQKIKLSNCLVLSCLRISRDQHDTQKRKAAPDHHAVVKHIRDSICHLLRIEMRWWLIMIVWRLQIIRVHDGLSNKAEKECTKAKSSNNSSRDHSLLLREPLPTANDGRPVDESDANREEEAVTEYKLPPPGDNSAEVEGCKHYCRAHRHYQLDTPPLLEVCSHRIECGLHQKGDRQYHLSPFVCG
jgi:hypothetical protein